MKEALLIEVDNGPALLWTPILLLFQIVLIKCLAVRVEWSTTMLSRHTQWKGLYEHNCIQSFSQLASLPAAGEHTLVALVCS